MWKACSCFINKRVFACIWISDDEFLWDIDWWLVVLAGVCAVYDPVKECVVCSRCGCQADNGVCIIDV